MSSRLLQTLFFVFIYLIRVDTHAQINQDSIKTELTKPHSDSTRAFLYFQLADQIKYNNPDSSAMYAVKGLELIEQHSYSKLEVRLWRVQGIAYYVKGSYDKALECFLKTQVINEEIGDTKELAYSYNNLGLIHAAQKDHEQGVEYYRKAIDINTELDNTYRLSNNFYNVGISFYEMGILDSAEFYFSKGLTLADISEHSTAKGRCQMFLGEVKNKLEKYDDAKAHFESALGIFAPDNKWDRCFAYAGYANVLHKTGEFALSEEYAIKSLELAQDLNAFWELQRVYKILSEIYAGNQKYELAYDMHKLHKQYADSVFNKEKLSEINRLHLVQEQLKTTKLQNENLQQQADISRQQLIFIFGTVVLILLVLLALFIYRNYLQEMRHVVKLEKIKKDIEQKNSELTELNETKDKLFSIIGHDLRGPISTMQLMFQMMSNRDITKEEFMEHVEGMSSSLQSLNFTLNNLLHWAKSQMLGASTRPQYFSVYDMVHSTVDLLKNTSINDQISVNIDVNDQLLAYADKEHLYLVIRNLISNALKFTPENGSVNISANRMPDEQIMIKVQDTGIGMTEAELHKLFTYKNKHGRRGLRGEEGTGLGLILCHEMISLNHGEIKVDSEPGVGSTFMVICRGKLAKADHLEAKL